jgi:hypothetical protein
VEDGKFVFTVGGKEMAVDPSRVEILGKEWFLNGEEEQTIAVKDESGSWWQYEFDRQNGAWVEKSLPEVSTEVRRPTRLEWNDIISGRWAASVRQAIKEGKIPTFDPSQLTDVRFGLDDDEFFKEYGMRFATPRLWAPDYLDLRKPGSFPIIYSAYGVMEVKGGKIGILTEQIAIDKKGSFVLFNLYDRPERIQYGVAFGRSDLNNVRIYFTPIVEINQKGCGSSTSTTERNLCEKWDASFASDIVREAVKKWVNGGIFEPVFERVLLTAGPTAYGY